MYNNTTVNVIIDIYNQPSPTPCWQLKIVGVYCIILFISSVTFNSLLLAVFIRNRELRTSLNTLIFAITILNLLSTVSELPFATVSTLSCRYVARSQYQQDVLDIQRRINFLFSDGCLPRPAVLCRHLSCILLLLRTFIS